MSEEIKNPYTYPDSDVYKNKLNIRDDNQLSRFEYMVSSLNGAQLDKSPIKGNYDIDHMSAIHKHLLKEVYDWAGKPRTLDFGKNDPLDNRWATPFAPAKQIDSISQEISASLREKNNLKNLDKETFVKELSTVYQQINYLHPFPEGNGRTTQVLIGQLAKEAGYEIDFKSMDKNVWNLAAARGQAQINLETGEVRNGNKDFMEKVFMKHTSAIDQSKQVSQDQGKESLGKPAGRTDASLAFEFEKPQDAVKKHPELISAFATVQAAKLFAEKYFNEESKRTSYVEKIKGEMIDRLDKGMVPSITVTEQSRQPDQNKTYDTDRSR